jgi:hypothetical protein
MARLTSALGILFLLVAAKSCVCADDAVIAVAADPAQLRLAGPRARFTLLVNGKTADGSLVDQTRAAHYHVKDLKIIHISSSGAIQAVGDGVTEVEVEVHGHKDVVRVEVVETSTPERLHFKKDIEPILSRFGCNSAGCHGAAEGQNGFKLSVFGFDPSADYAAIVKEGRGRRVFPGAPEHSLLLAKPAGEMPHGGGTRIARGSPEYQLLRDWIAAGAQAGAADAPRITSIRVEPKERLLAIKQRQQLRVIGCYSDGKEVDVTAFAKFQTNQESVGSVAVDGLVTAGDIPGEVAIMASYQGAVDTFRSLIPRPEKVDPYPPYPANNFIDGLVLARLKKLNIAPSELSDDAEYVRRVYLDVIGTLPSSAEARRFFADQRTDRRARLVDDLLERPEYADYWALKWADVLRVDRQALGHKQAYAVYRWIRDSIRCNKPFDQFARELLTADGPLNENAPAAFYKVASKPGDMAGSIAQIFLGVRITCAQCHHHPFDRWGQTDYYGMQAFFTQVSVNSTPRGEALLATGDPQTRHPRTGEVIRPHALGVPAQLETSLGDRRLVLADWLTSPQNPWFARNLANRTWAHFFGRGLVEPVDDVRDTNPPSNPELLDALARYVAQTRFDLKKLIRAITASRTYQLAAKPNTTNLRDESGFSRAYFRRIDAEVLLDMVSQTTGIEERFSGAVGGTRAIQLWDSKINHYFLKVFGRPQRLSACDCERVHEPSVAQVLHLLNAPEIHAKLAHERGRIATLVRQKDDDGALVEELYLTFLTRLPTQREGTAAMTYLARHPAQRQQAVEDLAWSLMNTLEFVFNH